MEILFRETKIKNRKAPANFMEQQLFGGSFQFGGATYSDDGKNSDKKKNRNKMHILELFSDCPEMKYPSVLCNYKRRRKKAKSLLRGNSRFSAPYNVQKHRQTSCYFKKPKK